MSVRKIKLSTNISIATILIQLLILLHSQTIQVVHCNAATSKSDANHKQLQQKANNNQTTIISSSSSNNNNNSNGLDEILRDTFQSLDFLNQKLDQVDNKTRNNESTILMREMRALDEDEADNKAQQIEASAADGGTPASLLASNYRLKDEELTQLAQGFSSERRLASSGAASDPLASSATSNNEQRSFVLPPPSAAAAAVAASKPADGIVGSTPVLSEPLAGAAAASKRARQLNPEDDLRMLASGSSGSKFDNEFTEKHIRFTLDMMRAIFSSQSYTTKTNSLDSFLISPVSVQLVLMMMHLGARGQTKRELSNALHFLSSSPTLSTPTTTTPATAAATNHSSVQHHEFMLGSLSNQNGANLSSGGGGSSSSNLLIKNAKLTRRHHQPVNNKQALQNQRQQQNQVSPLALNNNVHEQFGAAMRQLLKDSTVVRALTSANQIFVQKDLPLSPQYEWAVKHYYGADLKQVDFQNQSFDQHPQSQQQQQQQQPKSNGNLTNSNSNSNSGNSTTTGIWSQYSASH